MCSRRAASRRGSTSRCTWCRSTWETRPRATPRVTWSTAGRRLPDGRSRACRERREGGRRLPNVRLEHLAEVAVVREADMRSGVRERLVALDDAGARGPDAGLLEAGTERLPVAAAKLA